MAHEESKKAHIRKAESRHYQEKLKEAKDAAARREGLKKVIKPEDMPWENSPQGLIKHLANEKMDARLETVDIYMQFLPPGSRSGKHRHMAEEFMFILEGKGYSLHWDVDAVIGDTYSWKVSETPSRWEWEEGDSVYIPPNTVHQHFNADSDKPARFLAAQNRILDQMGFNDLEQIEEAPEFKAQN